jgi:sterol desaturase/sphingolipid hydroxylase (fatty acid hydroxylase superfamily)
MNLILAYLAGVVSWSLTEYVVHRWMFHGPRGRRAYNSEHLDHHAEQSYFAPSWKKVVIALMATAVVAPPVVWLVGWPGLAWWLGLLTLYAVYEVIHRRCHTHAPRGRYGRYVRKHHLYHHFHAPTKNHGVTSPLWDLAFRTFEKPGVIRVPERQVMVWLRDPATGDVAEPWAGDYRIARRRTG